MEITQRNPYARFFRSLKEIEISENTQIVINKNTVPDQRVYNALQRMKWLSYGLR